VSIRKALGATRLDLIGLVIGQALRFAISAVPPAWSSPLRRAALRSVLFGITPAHPVTMMTATLLLIAAVIADAYLPARRASAVDPARSLRGE
jgi:ABC-type antimicrobial peptide transport system permease subunit